MFSAVLLVPTAGGNVVAEGSARERQVVVGNRVVSVEPVGPGMTPESVPVNASPALTDVAEAFTEGCTSEGVAVCAGGDLESDVVVVLAGDSHAGHGGPPRTMQPPPSLEALPGRQARMSAGRNAYRTGRRQRDLVCTFGLNEVSACSSPGRAKCRSRPALSTKLRRRHPARTISTRHCCCARPHARWWTRIGLCTEIQVTCRELTPRVCPGTLGWWSAQCSATRVRGRRDELSSTSSTFRSRVS